HLRYGSDHDRETKQDRIQRWRMWRSKEWSAGWPLTIRTFGIRGFYPSITNSCLGLTRPVPVDRAVQVRNGLNARAREGNALESDDRPAGSRIRRCAAALSQPVGGIPMLGAAP